MSALDPEDYSSPAGKSKKFPQYLAAVLATLSSVSTGTYLSWTSGAFPLYGINGTPALTEDEQSWVGSLLPLGALVGALPAGWLADKLGRKMAILIVTTPLLLCWFVLGFAPSALWLFVGRFVAGAAIGAVSVVVPMYASEIGEPEIRGSLGTLFQLGLTFGILLGYLTALIGKLEYIACVSAVIPAVLLIGFPFMPESPAWLMARGRLVDAENSMQRLRGKNYRIQEELDQLQNNQKSQNKEKAGILELKNHKKAVLVSLGLMVFQQLSGINAVIFYAGEIFDGEDSALSPTVCSVILGIAQFGSTYGSTLLIDRLGRKILLFISSTTMAVGLLVLALNFHLSNGAPSVGIPWIPLISLTIFTSMFSIGFGPIPWLMVGEVSTTKVVGTVGSIAATLNWTLAFTVTKIFSNMKEVLGTPMAFGVFAVVCATGSIFVGTVVPETKGRTSDVIQMKLHRPRGKNAKVGSINHN